MLRSLARMKPEATRTVKLEMASRFEMLDAVQSALLHVAEEVGFAEDALHYMNVAVRESVVNAIKHGNRGDESKRVAVTFTLQPGQLGIEVQDEGAGFEPRDVPDPVAEENLLKPCGRGIFFMRQFMDEVSYAFPAKGGTIVRMSKRVA
jgi:serine/threonine-protein kinase RsbW